MVDQDERKKILLDGENCPAGVVMKILSTRTLYGPNVYHTKPVIIMTVDLEEWTDVDSCDIPNLTENLLQIFRGLKKHHCSKGHDGGFIERLRTGTYMGHIIEHLALELSVLTNIQVTYGKTRYAGRPGMYEIVVRFENEDGMKECLRQAFDAAKAAASSLEFNLKAALELIHFFTNRTKLGPSAQALLDAAKKRNIPYQRLGENSLIRLGYGSKLRRVQAAVTDMTSLVASDIAQDKSWTKTILKENFLPVPQGFIVSSELALTDTLAILPPPYAIKPFNGNHGNGVALNLYTKEDAVEAYNIAKKFSSTILIEEMCPGKDYRVLIVNGKMVAAAERVPPAVLGDGNKTVLELINEINLDPLRGDGHEKFLSKIEVDDILAGFLAKQNLTLISVVENGKTAVVRPNANLSSGGKAIDVTKKAHHTVVTLCERAARVVGLDICGIDLIHQDISLPVDDHSKIIEVNAGPGLRMHLAPSEGEAQQVAEPIIDMLYPNHDQGRIPIISVTGTNGKTTVVRMLHKIFTDQNEKTVGLTTTDGIWIGNEKIFSGDTTGPLSSQLILSDPKVDLAVLEVARGGLLRGGLAYDWSDISIITNIRPDHIGQDGIEDVEDLIWIKSVVAERVKENGVLVLNADDEASLGLRNSPEIKKVKKQISLFSLNSQNSALRSHRIAGGSACWVENDWVCYQHASMFEKLFKISDIPATFKGYADFQISNVLAAVSAAIAGGAEPKQITKSLKAFRPLEENMGRLNLYKLHAGYVLIDYGHNSDAITAVGKMLGRFTGYKKTAVFGMPGDRANQLIESGGEAIAHCFDHFILKDDEDLRGRKNLEVPHILQKSILSKNPNAQVQIIPDQTEAIHKALQKIKPNEIVGIFYEKFGPMMAALLQYDPQPIDFIPDHIQTSKQKLADSQRKELEHVSTL